MHPATEFLTQFFETEHLHPKLRGVVEQFASVAATVAHGPENAETTVALRKLIEAKDCAVRAIVASGALAEDGQQELDLEERDKLEFPCSAQLEVASGHSLYCTERGHHTTHRFSVGV